MIEQAFIVFTGCTAIWLSQDAKESRRRYASILGLMGQPFWFYAAYSAEQWGIFVMCFAYTAAWYKGFLLHWIKKPAASLK